MSVTVDAVFEGGVLKPLAALPLAEHQQVRVTIDTVDSSAPASGDNLLLNFPRVHTGIADLAENFDDYRFGRRTP